MFLKNVFKIYNSVNLTFKSRYGITFKQYIFLKSFSVLLKKGNLNAQKLQEHLGMYQKNYGNVLKVILKTLFDKCLIKYKSCKYKKVEHIKITQNGEFLLRLADDLFAEKIEHNFDFLDDIYLKIKEI